MTSLPRNTGMHNILAGTPQYKELFYIKKGNVIMEIVYGVSGLSYKPLG